jgi:DNA polymerase-3 subunit delta'
MPFSDFYGNAEIIARLREMLGRDRLPHSIILAGPRGSGKYTLAQMIAKTLNCQRRRAAEPPPLLSAPVAPTAPELPDFCGECESCLSLAASDDLDARCAEAVAAREALRETDRKETRILIQSHPDVLVIPPDPPQLMIKVDQVRHVIETIYHRPSTGGHRVFIFSSSAFMKEAANALLKVLEEPPEFATLLLLTENPGEFLPTIRSRCVTFTLASLPAPELERWLARRRPEWGPSERTLVARLSGGGAGAALSFDLTAYSAARKDALTLLDAAAGAGDYTALFRTTEGYRAGAEGREKTEQLLRSLYSLLEDLLLLHSGTGEMVRNRDIERQLAALASRVDFDWIARAAAGLAEVERGMRRNLLRNLSLDAFVLALERDPA